MKCGRYTCKKDLPDGTKICPDCEWEQNRKSKNKQPDDLEEFVEEAGDDESGRANHAFSIPASQAGENVAITAHTQIGNKRFEATKTVDLPKEKEKPPIKKVTAKNFFKTLKKYKGGGKK